MKRMKTRQPSALATAEDAITASLERPDCPETNRDRFVVACEYHLAFMAKLHNDQTKLVVASPPYNLDKDY